MLLVVLLRIVGEKGKLYNTRTQEIWIWQLNLNLDFI